MRRLQALSITLLVAVAAAGCGEGGTESGATVSVYVAAPLCREARQQLRAASVKAGDLRLRAVCLPPVEKKGRADLATAGRNARRATEDSTAVAYLEAPGAGAEFSRSVVESAEITWLETSSGAREMDHVVAALEKRGSSSPRSAVRESLESG